MASTGAGVSGPEGRMSSVPESSGQRRQLHVPATDRANTRSPRRGTTSGDEPDDADVQMNSHDALRELVAKDLGKFLPAHLTKSIQKQSQDLRGRIQALQKTNDRKKKLEDEITMLRAGQLPPTVKKVSHSFETALLDSPAAQDGLSFQIVPGDTIRTAKERCHVAYILAQKQMDLQLIDLHRSNLKEYVKRSNFVFRCSEHFQNRAAPAKTSCAVLDIDEDDIDTTTGLHEFGMTEIEFQGMIVSLYKKIVDSEAAKVLLDKASGDKKQQQKQQFLEQVANKSPQEFLNETIDERLKFLQSQKGKGKGKGLKTGPASAQLAVAAIQSYTGKISTDQAGAILADSPALPSASRQVLPATKAKPKPKGKGKGKGKSEPSKGKGANKGKGKSKTQNSTSAPSKGKGKSKSKNSTAPAGKGGGKSKGKSQGNKQSSSGWSTGRWARNWQ